MSQRIQYKVIELRIFNNSHFHNLHCEDKTKLGKYTKLKHGEVRVKGPKVQLFIKLVNPNDEYKELAVVVAKEIARDT